MTPTNKLRFVVRGDVFNAGETEHGDRVDLFDVRILQQWWENEAYPPTFKGEWRDVPVEDV